jgi:hypothetical protein
VALITDRFWEQSTLVARSGGLANLPRVRIPYPIAGSGIGNMCRIADDIADEILQALGVVGK